MGSGLEPLQQRQSNQVIFKILLAAFVVGLSLRFLLSADESLPVEESPATVAGRADAAPRKVKCDLFNGEWIPDPVGPAYTNESCKVIESPQNCMTNGRPDTGYLFWKWKPHGCDVPPFDAVKFLDGMRSKSWALIGDSMLRNHVQSLICLLSKAEEAVLVYHDDEYRSRRWHFTSHNFTLSLIWSPFLIEAEIFENYEGEAKSENRLHVNTLDKNWTSQYNSFDYVVISVGQWFLKAAIYVQDGKTIGCHYCPKQNLSELGFEYAYSKTLSLLFQFIATSEHKPVVIYRTWTPDHFEHGEWFSGGVCERTGPYKAGQYGGKDVDHIMRKVELEQFQRAVGHYGSENRANLKLLDTYQLSLLRPDAHPGPYRTFHPLDVNLNNKVQNDCLHWCLPGAIDTWNDLVMELVLGE